MACCAQYASHISNAWFVGSLQGNLGVSSLPGSYMVLDRPSNTLVPCNERRCPFATRYELDWCTLLHKCMMVRYRMPCHLWPGACSGRACHFKNACQSPRGMSLSLVLSVLYRTVLDVDGTDTTVWINRSPGFEALLAPINDKSPSTTQFYTFSVVSYVSLTACSLQAGKPLGRGSLRVRRSGVRVPSCLQLVRPDVSDALVFNPVAGGQAFMTVAHHCYCASVRSHSLAPDKPWAHGVEYKPYRQDLIVAACLHDATACCLVLAETLPTRNSQLDPAKWQAAGYNAADSARYCASHSAALTHPNLHVQIRVPGAISFVFLFAQLSNGAMAGNDTAELATAAQAQSRAILSNMARGNATNFRQIYWSSIVSCLASCACPHVKQLR